MRFSRSRLISLFSTALVLMVFYLVPEARERVETILSRNQVESKEEGMSRVTRIVDGDTLVIETGETVRLIGIDTPESVAPRGIVECLGKESATFLRELVEGKTVTLERDVSEQDRYGRLLRYVFLDGALVNETIVLAGYARAVRYPPDTGRADQLERAERVAREKGRGIFDLKLCPQVSN